jgi:hypothetical protein
MDGRKVGRVRQRADSASRLADTENTWALKRQPSHLDPHHEVVIWLNSIRGCAVLQQLHAAVKLD